MDTIDYGPLQGLIGVWKGAEGLDIAPESGGVEENPFYETITFEAGGTVTNAEEQTLSVVPYRQLVRRKSNNIVFHDQSGYWLWDPATGDLVQSLTIPRAVCCLSHGHFAGDVSADELVLEVSSKLGDPDWGILQSPFMREKAKTEAFTHRTILRGDTMVYAETTSLLIYGKPFEHTDENTLKRVG